MSWIAIAIATLLALGIARGIIRHRMNPLLDVSPGQLPDKARNLLDRVAPEFVANSHRMTEDERRVRLRGQYHGVPYSVSIDFDASGDLHEFEFETNLGGRMRAPVDRETLPKAVAETIDRILGDAREAYEEHSLAKGTMKGGPFSGEESFASRGVAHDFEWEIEVGGNGRLLEVEIESRRKR